MSTTNERSRNDIVIGDNIVTVIPYQFEFLDDPNVSVVVTQRDTIPDPMVETILVEGVDYVQYSDRIELAVPLAVGLELLVERVVTDIQPLDYSDLRPFPAEVHEAQEDRTFMSLCELQDKFGRTLLYSKFQDEILVENPIDGNYLQYYMDPNDNSWHLVNSPSPQVDLSAYYTSSQTDSLLNGKVDKTGVSAGAGIGITGTGSLIDPFIITNTDPNVAPDWGDINGTLANQTDLNNALAGKANASHNHSLADLTQSGAQVGDVPEWDGTDWVPTAPSGGGGTWGSIGGTLTDQTDLSNALNGKEPTVTAGTSGEYYRGDKTWQTLDKTAVGLSDVDNTSDADKPVSTAQQAALNGKANSSHNHDLTDLNQSGASSGQVAAWDGTKWAPATPSGGGSSAPSGEITYGDSGGTGLDSSPNLTVSISGGDATIKGGIDSNSGTKAGDLTIKSGSNTSTGNGGDIKISAGSGISFGKVILSGREIEVSTIGSGGLDMNNRPIKNLSTPVTGTDGVNYNTLLSAVANDDTFAGNLDFSYTTLRAIITSSDLIIAGTSNLRSGKTLVLRVDNTDSSDHDVDISALTGMCRPDMPLTVEAGKTNIYTFVVIDSGLHIACVDGLESF